MLNLADCGKVRVVGHPPFPHSSNFHHVSTTTAHLTCPFTHKCITHRSTPSPTAATTATSIATQSLPIPAPLFYTLALAISALISWVRVRQRHPRERGLVAGLSVGSSLALTAVPFATALFPQIGIRAVLLCTLVDIIATQLGSYMLFSTAGAAFPDAFKHLDGGSYKGEWKGMLKEGHGVYEYPGGGRYEGQWREGVKEGRGVYVFPRGGLYEGEWRGGVMSGIGVRTFASGEVKAGIWEGGKLAAPVEELQCALAVEGANEAAAVARNVVVGGASWGAGVKRVLAQPALWAFAVATAVSVLKVPLTATVNTATAALAGVHAPLALFAWGLTLPFDSPHQPSRRQIPDIIKILATRLLPPLLITSALSIFFGFFSTTATASATITTTTTATSILVKIYAILGPLGLCAVGPVATTVLEYAHIFRLNEALAAGLIQAGAASSLVLLPFVGVTAVVSASSGSVLPFLTAIGALASGLAVFSALAVLNWPREVDPRRRNNKVRMVYEGRQVEGGEAATIDGSGTNSGGSSSSSKERYEKGEDEGPSSASPPPSPAASAYTVLRRSPSSQPGKYQYRLYRRPFISPKLGKGTNSNLNYAMKPTLPQPTAMAVGYRVFI